MIKVLEEGFYTTIQDLGRRGFLRYGISHSGAMDEFSLRLGNIFLNTSENAPQIEITLKGPTIEFLCDKIICLTGGEIDAYINFEKIECFKPYYVKKGSILKLDYVKKGFRSYLIIQGGVKTDKFLNSASFDKFLNKGVKFKKGDLIQVSDFFDKEVLNRKFQKEFKLEFEKESVKFILGPDNERFEEEELEKFLENYYIVSEKSDRVAIRLDGEPLKLKKDKETIISEGVNLGTIQVPQNGKPIILMKDRPTTGGYPKIGNVIKVDIPILSQKRFGEKIKFKIVSIEEAQKLYFEMEEEIKSFKKSLGIIKKYYIILKDKKFNVKVEEIFDEENFNKY
ncbi:MAG: biotin-dependent carboxyltransferase family protein [Caldisericia bacterium]|nr:biotin-dependent carboxyltransferase family protein [Caldisericia bacterium]